MCATHSTGPEGPQEPVGTRYFMANLRQPGPLGWKVRRVLANNWIKLRRGQHCCGNAGEPGC
jgi:hypothetical protein